MYRIHAKRIDIVMEIWTQILNNKFKSRSELISFVEKIYKREKIEPIRGRSKVRMYEKELITIYILGKYGLGFTYKDYSQYFDHFFARELLCEKAFNRIKNSEDPRKVIKELFNEVSEDIIFKVIRFGYIGVLFKFIPEADFINVLKKFEKSMPELNYKFKKFKKFYIALRVAEAIVSGNVRTRFEKEAIKHALCLRLNAIKQAPSDDEIRLFATEIFGAEEYQVNSVLKKLEIEFKP